MGSEYRSIKRHKFSQVEVEKQWSRFSELKNYFTSKVEWWDRAKAMVKTIKMIFSIHKKQIETELEKTLEKEKIDCSLY